MLISDNVAKLLPHVKKPSFTWMRHVTITNINRGYHDAKETSTKQNSCDMIFSSLRVQAASVWRHLHLLDVFWILFSKCLFIIMITLPSIKAAQKTRTAYWEMGERWTIKNICENKRARERRGKMGVMVRNDWSEGV